jgi:4-amino-4-deoxy-L-arabinose transferase-like glycosyltransferase
MSIFRRLGGLGPTRSFFALLTLSTLAHLLVAGRAELSQDESHYALYGRFLDWSYYDHPPLVGWVQALALQFGESEMALRLWAISLGALSGWLIFRLARELFPLAPWRGVIALALLQGAVMMQLLSIAVLPDTLLVPAVLACTLFLHRAVAQGRSRNWLGVGVAMGLAGLAKYPAIALLLSVGLYLLVERRWQELGKPWVWIGALIAALLVSPVFYWNYSHEWASFGYQLGHGIGNDPWSLERFAVSQLTQIPVYGPLLFVAGIAGLVRGCSARADPSTRLLSLVALPLFLGLVAASGFEETLPHWTAPAWAATSLVAAGWLSCCWERIWVQWLTKISVGYSLIAVTFLHSLLFYPWLPFDDNAYPVADLMGWRQAALRATQLLQARAKTSTGAPVLFASNWSVASQLAWYAYPTPVQIPGERDHQINRWYGKPDSASVGIMVVPAKYQKKRGRADRFERCEHLEDVPILLRGRPATSYSLYWCEGYLSGGQR